MSLPGSQTRKIARAKAAKETPKLTSDWMLLDVLDAKDRDGGNEMIGSIIVPSTARFVGLRHCRVLLIGPGILDQRSVRVAPDCEVGDYVLVAGEDMVADVRTQVMEFTGKFAQARHVVAYSKERIE